MSRALLIALVSCAPARIVVEQPPITIVVPLQQPAQCVEIERVLVEDQLAQADAGENDE